MSEKKKRFLCPKCLVIQIVLLTILGAIFGFHRNDAHKHQELEDLKQVIQDTSSERELVEDQIVIPQGPLFELPQMTLPEKQVEDSPPVAVMRPPVLSGAPKIAIVIDDLGNDRVGTRRTIDLPGPLTLAFLPYAEDLEAQTSSALEAGHELMVHMPMEPVGDEYPGPNALLTGLSEQDFQDRLQKNLDAFDGYVGINNHMGSKLTQDRNAMSLVMQALKKRGSVYLDSRTHGGSVGEETALQFGVPAASRDVFLDHYEDIESVSSALAQVERIAKKYGRAIAIGHPKTATLDALQSWLPTLQDKGFELVPVSRLVVVPQQQNPGIVE